MKPVLYACLLLFLVLCACQPANPGPGDVPFDWCYTFDFTASNTGINTPYGSWSAGHGFTEDGAGRLNVSYSLDPSVAPVVTPGLVIVTVRRPSGVTGDINVQAQGEIFGIPVDQAQTLPSLLNSAILNIKPSAAGQQSATFNVSVLTTQALYFESIEVEGSGISPFPSNPCQAASDTPNAPLLPSNTPSPTQTITPSISPTPSQTLTPSTTPTGTLTPTPTPTDTCETVDMNFRVTDPVLHVISTNGLWVSGYGLKTGLTGSVYQLSGWIDLGFYIHLQDGTTVTLNSNGNSFNWNVDGYSDSGLTADHVTLLNAAGGITGDSPQDQGNSWDSSPYVGKYTRYVAFGISGFDSYGAYPAIHLEGCIRPDILPSATPTQTSTATATPLTPTSTQTRTAFPSTSAPAPTSTRLPILTLPPLGTLPPPNTPFGTPYGTPSTPGGTPNTGTPAITGPTPGIGGSGTPGAGTGGNGDGLNGVTTGIGEIGSAILSSASNAMRQGFSWLTEVGGVVGNITTAWSHASPQEVPGLPDCLNEPGLTEVCAIFYMLQYTVFSGPIGSLLIPLATAVMGLWTICNFVFLGRAILERLRRVTSV